MFEDLGLRQISGGPKTLPLLRTQIDDKGGGLNIINPAFRVETKTIWTGMTVMEDYEARTLTSHDNNFLFNLDSIRFS